MWTWKRKILSCNSKGMAFISIFVSAMFLFVGFCKVRAIAPPVALECSWQHLTLFLHMYGDIFQNKQNIMAFKNSEPQLDIQIYNLFASSSNLTLMPAVSQSQFCSAKHLFSRLSDQSRSEGICRCNINPKIKFRLYYPSTHPLHLLKTINVFVIEL